MKISSKWRHFRFSESEVSVKAKLAPNSAENIAVSRPEHITKFFNLQLAPHGKHPAIKWNTDITLYVTSTIFNNKIYNCPYSLTEWSLETYFTQHYTT